MCPKKDAARMVILEPQDGAGNELSSAAVARGTYGGSGQESCEVTLVCLSIAVTVGVSYGLSSSQPKTWVTLDLVSKQQLLQCRWVIPGLLGYCSHISHPSSLFFLLLLMQV